MCDFWSLEKSNIKKQHDVVMTSRIRINGGAEERVLMRNEVSMEQAMCQDHVSLDLP